LHQQIDLLSKDDAACLPELDHVTVKPQRLTASCAFETGAG
jgi:hypothetical protein